MKDARAEHRLQELSALVGGLAHEIKNPLSTININLELLREDWSGASEPLGGRSVKKIDILLQESRRLEKMLAEFLRMVSTADLDVAPTDLNSLLEDVIAFLGPELRRRNVQVTSQLDRHLPNLVVDANLIKQAILNLLKNALEAMEEKGGTVTIQTRLDGEAAVIEIIDTGPGISDDQRGRIFKAYYSTKLSGTGLGLPMVKKIVERHDGAVTCQSAPGRGTKFSITLPLHRTDDG